MFAPHGTKAAWAPHADQHAFVRIYFVLVLETRTGMTVVDLRSNNNMASGKEATLRLHPWPVPSQSPEVVLKVCARNLEGFAGPSGQVFRVLWQILAPSGGILVLAGFNLSKLSQSASFRAGASHTRAHGGTQWIPNRIERWRL